MSDHPTSRRRFLAHTLVLVAAAPLLGEATRAWAAPLPRLPLGNPQAKALHYIEDATKTKEPSHKPGSFCKDCQFFTPATGS